MHHQANSPIHTHHHGIDICFRCKVQEEYNGKIKPSKNSIVSILVCFFSAPAEYHVHEIDVQDGCQSSSDALPRKFHRGTCVHVDREDHRLYNAWPVIEIRLWQESTPYIHFLALFDESGIVIDQVWMGTVANVDLRAHFVRTTHADKLVIDPTVFLAKYHIRHVLGVNRETEQGHIASHCKSEVYVVPIAFVLVHILHNLSRAVIL
mmetsp:Transcript_135267/g.337489  ORF Transcript_135267/g.337489 Transcript_135267/m.337489 type:complete len:207 (-) Transcript_135267:153-773(-)